VRIPANTGSLERLDLDTQNYLRELAEDVKTIFKEKGVEEAHDRVDSEALDVDQFAGLWAILKDESQMRTALKLESKRRREAKPVEKAA
jgi:hypothetical protein